MKNLSNLGHLLSPWAMNNDAVMLLWLLHDDIVTALMLEKKTEKQTLNDSYCYEHNLVIILL